ncbi:acyltransferase family protein [Yersinia intermedia]|uniref:Acyltransferase family protein n=1 Tax=Yersinia intermedia TaxID=631 RepID=A0A0H5LR83_YERIN|nr:acyltransferase family protein [Yersinia intermedia]CRY53593.1 acyltransferase family protein [Yersinia intermedia]
MRYRSEIDGLRAIAVMFVILFHGGILFSSGFIGVDIFFVISGYLITSVIYNKLIVNEFSLSDFYTRRLWRLQPAFLLILLISFLVALIAFLPDDLKKHANSVKYSSLFLSNNYYANHVTDYFSDDANQQLLLHTWSLSIEWQFYIIFPLIVFGLYKLLNVRLMTLVIPALFLISFVIGIYLTATEPQKSYYLFFSRVSALLLGCSVSLYKNKLTNLSIKPKYWDIIGLICIVVLVYCASLDDLYRGYPNYAVLLPIVATAIIIIVTERNPVGLTTKFLSIKPLVFIGLISYSLYLWHWLPFAIIAYLGITKTTLLVCFIYLFSFAMAFISWKFIEIPCRKRKHNFRFSLIFLVILPIVISVSAYALVKYYRGIPQRFGSAITIVNAKINEFNSPARSNCIGNSLSNMDECTLGSKDKGAKKAIMIGDSYANHLWRFTDILAKDANINIFHYTVSSCLMLPDIYQYDWSIYKNTIYKDCHDRAKSAFELIKGNKYDYVIIGESWPAYLKTKIINNINDDITEKESKERLISAIDNAINIIVQSGATPVIMKSTFSGTESFRRCFYNNIKTRKDNDNSTCMTEENTALELDWIDDTIMNLKNKFPNLIIIDPKDAQCVNNQCSSLINGIPVYRDGGHITDYASSQFGSIYLERYGNPFKQPHK